MFPLPKLPLPLRPSDGPQALRAALEALLVLLLATQAARLVWLLLAPPGGIGAPAPADAAAAPAVPALALAFDPFHPGARAAPAADAAGYRLHGVRAAGAAGSAILSAGDGPQAAFRVGDEVAPGVALHAVAPDHVVLRTGGGDRRVDLDAAPSPAPAPRAAPRVRPAAAAAAGTSAGAPVDPAALMAAAGLRARTEGGRITGYTLIPRGDRGVLRQAGLEAGDVLLAVDGEQLTPERLGELEHELGRRGQVRLTVQRGGQTRTLNLRTTRP